MRGSKLTVQNPPRQTGRPFCFTSRQNFAIHGRFSKPSGCFPSSVPGFARSTFPVGEGDLPAGEGDLPAGEGILPAGEGDLPAGEGNLPAGEGISRRGSILLGENQRCLKEISVYQQLQRSVLELHHALGNVQA